MKKFCKTYYADFSAFAENEELIKSRLENVDGDRLARIERARYVQTKAEVLAGGLIVSAALADAFGIGEYSTEKNEFGKPYLTSHPEIFFNVSHSGNIVLCAVSDVECGIDVEDVTAPHDIMELAQRYMSALEVSAMMMSEDKNRAFCRLWTLRESYVKMRGRGFDIGLSTLRCDFHRGKASIYEGGVLQTDAFFKELYGIPGCQASLCLKEERENTVKKIVL